MVSFCTNINLYITNYNAFHLIYFQSDMFFIVFTLQIARRKKKEERNEDEMRNE